MPSSSKRKAPTEPSRSTRAKRSCATTTITDSQGNDSPPARSTRRQTAANSTTDESTGVAITFVPAEGCRGKAFDTNGLKYLPLGDLEIRILSILPGSEFDEIQCSLTHVECDSSYRCPRPYRALSYCWGNANDTLIITVNNSKLPVTRNLEAALRELRRREISEIWIDAICINENDDDERGHQVLKMKEIYQHAFETFVWLGEETEHTKEAFSLLNILGTEIPETEFLARTRELSARYSRRLKGPSWAALASFMDLPYWQRTWIIQEVVLSQKTIILWGQEAMSIETLSKAVSTIRRCKRDFTGFFDGYTFMQGLLRLWRKEKYKSPRRDLLEILSWSCASRASEERDKVFGLLGLSSDGKDLVPEPNYQEPIDSIVRRITVNKLMCGSESTSLDPKWGALDIICLDVPWTPRRAEIPSWVVDWVVLWASDRGGHVSLRFNRSLASMGASVYKYQACGQSVPSVHFSSDERTLVCRGYIFDTILALCKKHPKIKGSRDDGCENAASRDTEVSLQNNVYGSETDLHEAIWRSIVQDRRAKRGSTEAPDSFAQHFQTIFPDDARDLYEIWQELHAEYFHTVGDFEIHGREVRTWSRMYCDETRPTHPIYKETINPNKELFWKALHFDNFYRRLMETMKGYVGLAHAQSQAGDVIALLQGASVPIILRPCEGGYKVIGESYVHGIMDGEYWDAQDEASMIEFHIK